MLDNIAYGRALNSEHQMELIEEIGSNFTEGTFRLLIIDSIMAHFRVDVSVCAAMTLSSLVA